MSASRNIANFGLNVGGLIGEIGFWSNSAAPTGYLVCDGSAISRITYADLFSVIGTLYGVGNGTTTFNLPDYRDRMPIGIGNLYGINAKGGNRDSVNISHDHGVTDTGHGHGITDSGHFHSAPTGSYTGNQPGYSGGSNVNYNGQANSGSKTTGISVVGATTGITINSSGNDGTNANLPPYTGTQFIIRYQ